MSISVLPFDRDGTFALLAPQTRRFVPHLARFERLVESAAIVPVKRAMPRSRRFVPVRAPSVVLAANVVCVVAHNSSRSNDY